MLPTSFYQDTSDATNLEQNNQNSHNNFTDNNADEAVSGRKHKNLNLSEAKSMGLLYYNNSNGKNLRPISTIENNITN